MPLVTNLDTPLLRLSPHGDLFTLRDACQGVHIFGGTGSGKTSGVGRLLAGAYLRAGMGGLITTVKAEEITLWRDNYAPRHGRSRSLIVFDENEGFNFLEYLMAVHGPDGIGSITGCLMRVIDMARRASGTASQRGGDVFWEDSSRNALRYLLPPLYAATGTLTVPDIIRGISTAPASRDEVVSRKWQESSFFFHMLRHAAEQPRARIEPSALNNIVEFWRVRWPAIPEKTRGNIVITVTAALDRFNHGRLKRSFTGRTTIVPELSLSGSILLAGMPSLTWGEDGVIAQQLLKFLWQTSVLARNRLDEKYRERPLFLWCDEAQETVNSYDGEFIALCRGAAKCCMTFLSQSLPGYVSKIGGDTPREDAQTLVGKFATQVWASNNCPETNDFAARMLGRVVTRRNTYNAGTSRNCNRGMNTGNSENKGHSRGSSYSWGSQTPGMSNNYGDTSGTGSAWGSNRGLGTSRNESVGYSENMDYAIEPGDFSRMLKTGGPGNEVTAVWFQASRRFRASNSNWLLARFGQE